MLTISKIEGNSGIGCPVFSKFGLMQNFHFKALTTVKKENKRVKSPLLS
jgi:hypothetical protein